MTSAALELSREIGTITRHRDREMSKTKFPHTVVALFWKKWFAAMRRYNETISVDEATIYDPHLDSESVVTDPHVHEAGADRRQWYVRCRCGAAIATNRLSVRCATPKCKKEHVRPARPR
jgi:hypothetical protein